MVLRKLWPLITSLLSFGATASDEGWLYYGGDQGGRHYSDAVQIDKENVSNLGGGITIGGGVFFIGASMDRQIRAFDVSNGATLWKYTLPNDATATPMTYVYGGRQYVVINAGGHFMFQRGYGDYLYAFALPQ